MNEKETAMRRDLAAPTESGRDSKTGQFLPGNEPANRGRGASGRTKALQALDTLLAIEDNQRKLQAALQVAFDKNPVRFFQNIVMPLLPKEAKVEMGNEGRVLWTRICDMYPPEEEARPAPAP